MATELVENIIKAAESLIATGSGSSDLYEAIAAYRAASTKPPQGLVERVAKAIYESQFVDEFPTSGVEHALFIQCAAAALREAATALRASDVPGWPEELTGKQWAAARDAFVKFADQYRAAETYEMASAFADIAPEGIYKAILSAVEPKSE